MTGEKSDAVDGPTSLGSLYRRDHAESFYDERYRRGYMEEWPPEKLRRVRDVVRGLALPSRGRALDFGCGTGVFTAVLQEALPNWEVHGTDISTEALGAAKSRLRGCHFHSLADCAKLWGTYDFVFSHHVLEHVSSLPDSAELIARVLKPTSAMLHILPCGDQGSLEHYVCRARSDGVERDREGRFFYEEEGHLRRLKTDDLVGLWSDSGFRLERAQYANHFFGAIGSLTDADWRFLLRFADPRSCGRTNDRIKVMGLRVLLLMIWALRQPAGVVGRKRKFGCMNSRDFCLLSICTALYPASALVDYVLRKLARCEWGRSRSRMGGSEMLIFLVRAGGQPG